MKCLKKTTTSQALLSSLICLLSLLGMLSLTMTISGVQDLGKGKVAEPAHNCRMYGAISDNLPDGLLYDHLRGNPNSLYYLSETGNVDGWGIAYYPAYGGVPTIERGLMRAYSDPDYTILVNSIDSSKPNITLVHIRNCTSGCCDHGGYTIPNPHPFYRDKNGKTWTFEHNGGVSKARMYDLIDPGYLEANPPNSSDIPECDPSNPDLIVDSELYFLFLLQKIEENNWNVIRGIVEALNLMIDDGETGAMNFILSDGQNIWAFRKGTSSHPLYYIYDEIQGYAAAASQYPSSSQGNWIQMTNYQLVVLASGSTPEVIDDVTRYTDDELLVDPYFNDSADSADLRADGAGQDWYESRNDVPALLTLDTADIGGNTGSKAALTNFGSSGNAYLTQEFSAAQTSRVVISLDIFIDRIEDNGNYDRSGLIYIGNDSVTSNAPTGTSNERFVFLTFYDSTPGDTGSDLEIRARTDSGQPYGTTSDWTLVTTGLSYDTWYSIILDVDLAGNNYDLCINDELRGENISKYSGYSSGSVDFVSFVADSDGRGDFYIDNVWAWSDVPPTSDLVLDANFDSGSIGLYSMNGNVIDLALQTEHIYNTGDNYTYWANFKLSNVLGEEITLNFTGIDVVPFLAHQGTEENQMVHSCDGETWNRFIQHTYTSDNGGTYTITETFLCDEVQIATFFPFSYQRMQDFIDTVTLSEWTTRTVLGSSLQGRAIDLLTITNPGVPAGNKEQIYIIGRQHAAETASSHMLKGMIDFLISDDPDAQTMRDNFVCYIVPMVNPDGVYEGKSRATSELRDPNREWGNNETDEVNIVRDHIESINNTYSIDMFIDWHSQMNDVGWYNFIYSPPGNTFFPYLSQWTDFDQEKAVGTSCSSSSCSSRGYTTIELGLFTFVFEPTPHLSTWTTDSLNQQGINTAYAIADYFGALEPTPNVSANNSGGPITIQTTDTLSIKVELGPGSHSDEDADWWVVAATPFAPP
ncbi:MAG: hypothetical protein GY774_40045, partial [Planctomycetes bacterium]|nr:hypothetical protein [Planctomycetota bacterium]